MTLKSLNLGTIYFQIAKVLGFYECNKRTKMIKLNLLT